MLERITHRGDYHPDLRLAAAVLPRGVASARTVPWLRRLISLGRRGGGVSSTAVVGPGVGLRVFEPGVVEPAASTSGAGRRAAVLWLHGGGYMFGTAAQDDSWCRYLADEEGVLVVSVDYRLAPEHRYPEPVDDCMAALEWVIARDDVDPRAVVVAGASAGGGLAASVAFRARDAGIDLALQLLVYPMLDDRTTRDDVRYRLWDAPSNAYGWQCYLGAGAGAGADRDQAVPARRTDLEGLAPAWIGVGSLDLFLDEDLDYAARLREAGVDCQLDVIDGAFHGFDLVLPGNRLSRGFADTQRKVIAAAVASRMA